MVSLYLDTHRSVIVFALYKDEKLWKKKEILSPMDHSMILIPSLKEFLEENHLKVEDLSDLVVVTGPGSFTGVRLGVTIAKTLSYSLNIPIRGLTSLECFLPIEEKNVYLSIPEKNGYFIGKLDEKKITKYLYLSKDEFAELKQINKVLENLEINYETLIQEAHKKETMNPHQVNPFYVKKIEVEK